MFNTIQSVVSNKSDCGWFFQSTLDLSESIRKAFGGKCKC